MDAREIRVGNWFMGTNIPFEWTVDDFQFIGDTKASPIPLTEQWLLDFGFETMDAEMDLMEYAIEKDGTLIFSIINEGGLNHHDKNPFYITSQGQLNGWAHEHKIEIKYVHSLQNLYFSLTGQELNI